MEYDGNLNVDPLSDLWTFTFTFGISAGLDFNKLFFVVESSISWFDSFDPHFISVQVWLLWKPNFQLIYQ